MKKSDATFDLLTACVAALGATIFVRYPLERYNLLASEPFDLIQILVIVWLVGFVIGWTPSNTKKNNC